MGPVWFRLGYALHADGRLKQAIEAHRKAATFPRVAPTAKYNLACALAMSGDKEGALRELKSAIDAGFYSARPIVEDSDLSTLRDDPRFQELAKKAKPPYERSDYRELDFWVGQWKVFGPGGEPVGTSDITKSEKGFAITENWTSKSGATGVSLNYFDPVDKNWRQVWVDASGNVVRYTGSFGDGKNGLRRRTANAQGQYRPKPHGTDAASRRPHSSTRAALVQRGRVVDDRL